MINYFEGLTLRKKASNLLHLSLIALCAAVSIAYWMMIDRPVNTQFLETFKCAVHNAGIGEWKWNKINDSFECDHIAKSMIGDVTTFSEFLDTVDQPDRNSLVEKFHTQGDIVVTCKVRGKEFVISGVSSNGIITGIIQPLVQPLRVL